MKFGDEEVGDLYTIKQIWQRNTQIYKQLKKAFGKNIISKVKCAYKPSNYVAQLIKYNAESTDHKMFFHSKETWINLLLNAQRKIKIKNYPYNVKINFLCRKICNGQSPCISVKCEAFLCHFESTTRNRTYWLVCNLLISNICYLLKNVILSCIDEAWF